MNNELSDRQQAIKLRLAGRSVEEICRILSRSPAWFHIWWRRYRALGPNGLFDLTRTTTQPRRITPDLERSILNIRRRLISQTHPGTRYSLIGAGSILAELQVLGSLGIAVIFPHLGAKSAFWREIPPYYMEAATPVPNEPSFAHSSFTESAYR